MKVLMLTTGAELTGGVDRHILEISRGLKARGVDVAVCTQKRYGSMSAALEECGIRTFSLGVPNGHDIRIFSRFVRVLREYKPDVVHVHLLPLFCKIVLRYLYGNLTCVVTVHGISNELLGVGAGTNASQRFTMQRVRVAAEGVLCRLVSRRFSMTIYISKGVRRFLAHTEEDSAFPVIYNPISPSRYPIDRHVCQKLLGLPESVELIGSACRVAEPKNPMALVATMIGVLKRRTSTRAVLIGTGEDEVVKNLHSMVDASGVSERFHFVGYRKDAPELVASFSCYVMTSRTEGMPTGLLEAMNVEVPIAFMSGHGGLEDLDEYNRCVGPIGTVVRQGDVDGLVDGVCHILEDNAFAQSCVSNASALLERCFRVSVVAEQLERAYKTAIKEVL